MEESTLVAIVAATISGILVVERWVKRREMKELALGFERRITDIKHDNEKEKVEIELKRLYKRLEELHDKASERHGDLQGRMLKIELDIKDFMGRAEMQLAELYRAHNRNNVSNKVQ